MKTKREYSPKGKKRLIVKGILPDLLVLLSKESSLSVKSLDRKTIEITLKGEEG